MQKFHRCLYAVLTCNRAPCLTHDVTRHHRGQISELVGATFWDSDPTFGSKFLNPYCVRTFFKFENPTLVLTRDAVDPTEIYQYFYLRNDHEDSCYCRKWKVTLAPDSGPKEKRRILPKSNPGSPLADIQPSQVSTYASRHYVTTVTAFRVFNFSQHFSPNWP